MFSWDYSPRLQPDRTNIFSYFLWDLEKYPFCIPTDIIWVKEKQDFNSFAGITVQKRLKDESIYFITITHHSVPFQGRPIYFTCE